jgi:hypothetical protein
VIEGESVIDPAHDSVGSVVTAPGIPALVASAKNDGARTLAIDLRLLRRGRRADARYRDLEFALGDDEAELAEG